MFADLRLLDEIHPNPTGSAAWVCREGSSPAFSAGWTHDKVWSYTCSDAYHETVIAASAASAALPLFHAGMSAAEEALVSGKSVSGSNVDAAAAKASAIAFSMNKALKKHSDRVVSTVNTEVGVTW